MDTQARHTLSGTHLVLAACLAWLALATPAAGASSTETGPTTAAGQTAQAGTTWDQRGDAVLSVQEALAALDTLPADQPAPVSWHEEGARTGWFGQAWEDVDGDGCDTRNEILARDLIDPDLSRADGRQGPGAGRGEGVSSCPDATVYSGTLTDPYTGSTVVFTRGQDTSAAVQVDHVVPLAYLYAHGAWAWDGRTRLLVANDPLNLLAVDGGANQDKGACGPATCPTGTSADGTWDSAVGPGWWPPDASYRCAYARRFVSVAAAYRMGLPVADVDALRTTLVDCAGGGDGASGLVERAGQVGHTVWAAPVPRGLAAVGAAVLGAGLLARGARRRAR